jgi:hypothetical protein
MGQSIQPEVCSHCLTRLNYKQEPRSEGAPDDVLAQCPNDKCEVSNLSWQSPELFWPGDANTSRD